MKHIAWLPRLSLVQQILLSLSLFLIWMQISSVSYAAASQRQNVTWNEVNQIAAGYHPPGCPPNLTGSTCQEQQANDLRLKILKYLQQGKSKSDIQAILIKQYGADILSVPKAKGVGLFVWLIPVISFMIGVLLFGWFLRKHANRSV